MYTVTSLFAGAVDGLSIAFQQAGFNVTCHVEWDPWCCRVLSKNFPESAVIRSDIRDLTTIPYTDVFVGSPPCQPWSIGTNGRRAADDRHLWPEMLRLVRAVRPRCVAVENVDGGVSRGLADEICLDLESAEYTAETLVLPARAVGAPHWRTRLFVVAYTELYGRQGAAATRQPTHHQEWHTAAYQQSRNAKRGANLAGSQVLGRRGLRKPGMERTAYRGSVGMDTINTFPGWPARMGETQESYEPPRLKNYRGTEDQRRIRAIGNAIVWQQVFPLAQAVSQWLQTQDGIVG